MLALPVTVFVAGLPCSTAAACMEMTASSSLDVAVELRHRASASSAALRVLRREQTQRQFLGAGRCCARETAGENWGAEPLDVRCASDPDKSPRRRVFYNC